MINSSPQLTTISIDGSFLPWTATLRSSLLKEYPLPEGSEPIPDSVLLDPKWLLDFADSEHSAPTNGHLPSGNGDTEELPDQTLLEIPGGITANVTSNDRLTPTTHWQDVRHLKLHVEGSHPYVPGDVLTIYPKNFPTDVDHFLAIMDWMPIADQRIRFTPSSSSVSPTARLPVSTFTSSSTTTLRELLTNHLDILSIPRRSFFAKLAHYTSDEFHRDRLLEFTDPEYIDELFDYTTRPRRSILEVLQEFESVKIPWQRVCSIIPTLRGRQFSIASAMTEIPSTAKDSVPSTRIELLIAIVKYKTVIKRIRQGVATRYIASLAPRQQLTVTLSRGGLGVTQNELNKPVVMIGPGTGVAPMRALIQQRMRWRSQAPAQTTPTTNDLLFFGCRNAESDYFFKDDWKGYIDSGVPLEVFAAFSRDQRQKVYVQDLVRQQSRKVYDAVVNKDGILYICGSSGKMPQAVREALIEGFQEHGELSREDAEAYLVALEKGGRYRQETW
jgi:sulfite reductase alpha subunit-like flavoprotein